MPLENKNQNDDDDDPANIDNDPIKLLQYGFNIFFGGKPKKEPKTVVVTVVEEKTE